MNSDQTFRLVLIIGAIILFPIALYYRIRSQSTREKLDRWQEGKFILFTLRPIGLATMAGLIAYLINPSWMEWSSLPLPGWVRWMGVGMGMIGGALIVWAFSNLGKNLTDTVVTRRDHTLVVSGPYRWVRHPFYLAVLLTVVANALAAANWFLLLGGISVFLLMVIRTKTEEAKLLERFGDQYRTYMTRTGRFLPKIGARGRLS
ncbi:MAG: isoprenylcysteine carboxylmethyltransferase family protein [Vicinamibacterales bacterium]